MITFSLLGNHGRLGNQMFQYAMLKGISYKKNYILAIPKDNHQLFECFDLKTKVYDLEKNKSLIDKLRVYRENNFSFDENVFNNSDNTNYVGNYQTEKYFNFIREEILKDFKFKEEIFEQANKIFNSFNKETVSIHIRRGDYVNLQNFHPVCSKEYYLNALQEFKNCKVICFSDDINWCKENLKDASSDIYFSQTDNPYVDLCLMSMCNNNIIANSSYSWWGAWLNKNENKKIIAPETWFGPSYSYHDTKDLIPEGWRKCK